MVEHEPPESPAATVTARVMNHASRIRAYPLILSNWSASCEPEVRGPAAQEPVDVLGHPIDRQQQPGPGREFTEPGAERAASPPSQANGQEQYARLPTSTLTAH